SAGGQRSGVVASTFFMNHSAAENSLGGRTGQKNSKPACSGKYGARMRTAADWSSSASSPGQAHITNRPTSDFASVVGQALARRITPRGMGGRGSVITYRDRSSTRDREHSDFVASVRSVAA